MLFLLIDIMATCGIIGICFGFFFRIFTLDKSKFPGRVLFWGAIICGVIFFCLVVGISLYSIWFAEGGEIKALLERIN